MDSERGKYEENVDFLPVSRLLHHLHISAVLWCIMPPPPPPRPSDPPVCQLAEGKAPSKYRIWEKRGHLPEYLLNFRPRPTRAWLTNYTSLRLNNSVRIVFSRKPQSMTDRRAEEIYSTYILGYSSCRLGGHPFTWLNHKRLSPWGFPYPLTLKPCPTMQFWTRNSLRNLHARSCVKRLL